MRNMKCFQKLNLERTILALWTPESQYHLFLNLAHLCALLEASFPRKRVFGTARMEQDLHLHVQMRVQVRVQVHATHANTHKHTQTHTSVHARKHTRPALGFN